MFEKWKVASFKKITATFILTLQNHASRCWTDRRWGFISFEVSVHLSTTETPKKARQKLPILRISLWNSKIRQKSTVANLAIEGPPAYVPIFPLSNHATCVSLRHQHQKLFAFRRPLLFSFGTMWPRNQTRNIPFKLYQTSQLTTVYNIGILVEKKTVYIFSRLRERKNENHIKNTTFHNGWGLEKNRGYASMICMEAWKRR